MTPRLLVAVALVLMAVGNTTYRINQHQRALVDEVYAPDRFVDISVLLRTVVQDPNGVEYLPGKPKLRIVREQVFGGIVDTKLAVPQITSTNLDELCPAIWYCSEEQEPIVLHGDDVQPLYTVGTARALADVPLGQLVYGSEGAGKTTTLVMWLYFRWFELLGGHHQIGVSAPIEKRVGIVYDEFAKMWPSEWFSYSVGDGIATLVDGTTLRFASTYQQSSAQGSRWQGFNLAAHAGDEFQDSLNVAEDIEMRGRSAPNGRYKRIATATAKDSPDWREFRDRMLAALDENGKPQWIKRTLYGERSPFVPASFWIKRRASLSEREAKRRLDAMDVPPERATYPAWDRGKNLIRVPEIGWQDVTAQELARFTGPNRVVLTGHDPGTLVDVSLFLKEYRISAAEARRIGAPLVMRDASGDVIKGAGPPPIWIVHDEVSTYEDSTDAHILAVLKLARDRWHCNFVDRKSGRVSPDATQIFTRADPAGDNDARTDISVYTQWRNHDVDIRPAAYSKQNPTKHGRVPKDPGIEMVNALFCSSYGERRLFVALKPDGTPCAPKLVAAIETSERDLAGKAETQLKRKGDVSHWPAALRYALWMIERPRLGIAPAAGTQEAL